MAEITIIEATTKRVMTAVVNKRVKGKKALTAMLFPPSTEQNLTAEHVQVDQLTGANGMAPFVEKNGKAIAIDQLSGDSYLVTPPSINIKRTLTCNDLLLQRLAGQNVMVVNGEDVYKQAAEAQIADDLTNLDENVENRIEWMVAMLLRGVISYKVDGKASFKITTAKPGGNTFTVTDLWSGATPQIFRDIKQAKRVVQPYGGPGFQVAVCGRTASDALTKMVEAGTIKSLDTTSGIVAGMASLIADYQENGMLYLGTFGGIPFFEYAGSFIDDTTGAAAPFVRDDHVEFICTAKPDMRVLYYGVIRDIEAILAGMHIAKKFATSDTDKDSGTFVAWLKSRPLPWFKRPDWNVSMKVV
jgi:hypothetical protein